MYPLSERPLFVGIRDEWTLNKFADVKVYCKNNEMVRSHRIILATLSHAIRKALMQDQTREEDSVIIIPDVCADVLGDFLENIYMGSYDDVRISTDLDYLGFADQMVMFTLPDPDEKMKMEPTDYQEMIPSQNYINSITHYTTRDDSPDCSEPEVVVKKKPRLKKRAAATLVDRSIQKVDDEATIAAREEAILHDREADPDQPVKRVPKPSKSNIWHFFRISSTKGLATCRECGRNFKNTSGATTTLRRHLQNVHDELFEELMIMDQDAAERARKEKECAPVVAADKVASRAPKNKEKDDCDDDEDDEDAAEEDPDKENEKGEKEKGTGSRPKRSAVWKYFSLDKDGLEENKALCNLCEKPFVCSLSATTNLVRHLEAKHPDEYEEFRSGVDERKKKLQEKEEELNKGAIISLETVDAKVSRVWEFFDQDSLTHLKCRECGQLFKTINGSTSSALRHIRQKHPDLEKAGAFRNERIIWQFFNHDVDEENCAVCLECKIPVVVKNEDTKHLVKHLETGHSDAFDRYNELMETQGWKRRVKMISREGKKKRAAIWHYFDRTAKREEHKCKACLKVFQCKKKNPTNLTRHLKQFHEKLYDRFMKDSGYDEEEIKAFKVTKKRGPKPKSIQVALDSRTCPKCNKVYSTKKNMELHMEAVHSGQKPFECEECGMKFSRKESFKRHTHSMDKPFLCSVCGKTFARRHIRDVHERAHYGEKKYPCDFCEKRFTTNQKKMIHERIHTGDKPYHCKECGKKFVQHHQLQTHMRIHTGDRPYRCEHCNQLFRHLSTRAKHNCAGRIKIPPPASAPVLSGSRLVGSASEGIEIYEEQQSDENLTKTILI
jgi:DNA-directed RNA polymerase subunit RPC12/RpoP